MERSTLPTTAFIDPQSQNAQVVQGLAHQVLDQVLDHLTQATTVSPLPDTASPHTVLIPDASTPDAELLSKLQQLLRESMNAAHPGYIGHMDSIPTTVSILGDLVAAALNNNLLSVEMSPFFSRLEPLLLQQIAALFGLGDRAGGILVSGGSLANLQALAVARNVTFPVLEKGIAPLDKQPVLFASEVAHTSIQKAAMLLGLGTQAVIRVATNENSQIQVDDLRAKIAQAEARGQHPFAVVATAGTTVTGNIDPLAEMGAIARDRDLWFHVDAAYGGGLMFSPKHRDRLAGIEQADSVTFNPQKWLYVAKTCASVLFRDMGQLKTAFRIPAPYMGDDADWMNLGEITVQGTRHADVLKLWLSLQHIGQRGYAQLIDESYVLTEQVVVAITQRPFLQLASQPEMNLVCFRGEPDWLPPAQWDQWNSDLQQFVLRQAEVFLSLPVYRQQRWLKAVLLNPYTDQTVMNRLFDAVDQFAQKSKADLF